MRVQRFVVLMSWVSWMLAAGLTAQAAIAAPQDAAIARTDGSIEHLSSFRGKPVVIFYESRESTELNRPLKNELFARRGNGDLVSATHVVPIAALERYDFFPLRFLAQRAVKDVEKKVGVPVFIDWKGALSGAPWNLPANNSTVMLLDKDGNVVFEHSGALNPRQLEMFFNRVEMLLGTKATAAPSVSTP